MLVQFQTDSETQLKLLSRKLFFGRKHFLSSICERALVGHRALGVAGISNRSLRRHSPYDEKWSRYEYLQLVHSGR